MKRKGNNIFMVKYIFSAFLAVTLATNATSQVEINTLIETSKAEFKVVSPGNNKGVLIPRIASANISSIASPVDGLLVYNSSNNTFYYYNAATSAWQRIGDQCTIIVDNDGDTKIEVDLGHANDDKIHYFVKGVEIVTQTSTSVTQAAGNLQVTGGSVKIGSAYTLPIVDGTSKFILVTNGSGTLSWQNPLTLPGLVAGIQNFPLGMGKQYEPLGIYAYLTVFIPWSNISVTKISTYVTVAGSPIIEIGIYDDLTLLSSAMVSPATSGLVTVTLASSLKLKAGKLYRIGIVDRSGTGTSVLEYPTDNSLNWSLNYSRIPSELDPDHSLPNPIVTHSDNIRKIFWYCLY